jgi:UTP--glucose-1-phosphate uridylyltransferase
MAQAAVGDRFFAVLLADDLILPEPDSDGCLAQMLAIHRHTGASVVAVEQVPREHINRYGVVAVDDFSDNFGRISSIVEKPSPDQAPSDLGVVGRYILAPAIFDLIDQVKADQRGEIQLTDAIAMLLQQQPVYACRFAGTRHDCGHHEGFVHATLDVAMRKPKLRASLLPAMHKLLEKTD